MTISKPNENVFISICSLVAKFALKEAKKGWQFASGEALTTEAAYKFYISTQGYVILDGSRQSAIPIRLYKFAEKSKVERSRLCVAAKLSGQSGDQRRFR